MREPTGLQVVFVGGMLGFDCACTRRRRRRRRLSLILFTLAGNINNSRSLRLRFLGRFRRDRTAAAVASSPPERCLRVNNWFPPRNPGGKEKGTAAAAAAAAERVRGWAAVGPTGRAWADVLRTKYDEREEREKEADNKQGRRTDGRERWRRRRRASERGYTRSAHLQTSYISICRSRSYVVRILKLQQRIRTKQCDALCQMLQIQVGCFVFVDWNMEIFHFSQ